ncbi:MAG: hypothetical protein WC338_01825 [Candidatus Ratteibacteria bacterium]
MHLDSRLPHAGITKIRSKNGYLLPMVIIYMIIAMIVGAGIMVIGSMDRIEANKRLHREQAFYLAEAGIDYARYQLKQSSSWMPNPNPMTVNLGAGSFELTQTINGNTITNTSTGKVNGVKDETIVVNLTKGSGGGYFSQGLFGASQISIYGSSQIYGYDSRTGAAADASTGSNSSIYINSTGIIHGDAAVPSTGSITYPSWSPNAITGDQDTNAALRTPDPVTIPTSLTSLPRITQTTPGLTGNFKVSGGNYTMSSWPRDAGITAGDYHLKSLSIASDAELTISGTVRLYIENALSITNNSNGIILGSGANLAIYMGGGGAVTFSNSAQLNYNDSPANIAIYVTGSPAVSLTGNCRINAAIYAPGSTVTISGSSELRGGVIANQVNLTGNVRLYDDVSLGEVPPPGDSGGGGGITFFSWTKPSWKR